MDLGLNRRAAALADAMAADADALRVGVSHLDNGARLIDCGIDAEGGLEAGRRLSEICLAGRATVSVTTAELGPLMLPAVRVITDDPVPACLASQYAGWAIQRDSYFAMGSGPARCLSRAEEQLFDRLAYVERADRAVLVLEGRTPPSPAIAAYVAERCGVEPRALTLLIAPTASVAGCVQIAARSVETALHKLMELGFDLTKIRSGTGLCPIAPVAKNDLRGIGWTNDCILYGARSYLTVRATDQEIDAVAERLPASSSADYGTPFYDIFNRYDRQFYKIDKMLFSPAEVTINNLLTGRVIRRGHVNPDVLQASLGLA
jgi:methenyltetrahydromethanopterin cyclohydrolase